MSGAEPFRTVYHQDGTVTVWNVYAQAWQRTAEPSDRILASLTTEERARVVRHCQMDAEPAAPTRLDERD